MAHEISIVDGVAEAAFAGQPAWHGLGTVVPDKMTPMCALGKAHLNWEVEKFPVTAEVGGVTVNVPDKFAAVRTDTKRAFGIVGPQYTFFQNHQQAQFLEALVGQGAVVECVGALFHGAKTFWTVKSPEDMIVKDKRFEDRIKKYLILFNSHDGTNAFRAFWSPIRVVCNNTLRASLEDAHDGISIKHTGNLNTRIEEARRVLGYAKEYYAHLKEVAEAMAARELVDKKWEEMLTQIFGEDKDAKTKELDAKVLEQKNQARSNLQEELKVTGKKSPRVWDAYNAITYMVSHQMGQRKTKRLDNANEAKFEYVLFGNGNRLSQKAFDVALALAA